MGSDDLKKKAIKENRKNRVNRKEIKRNSNHNCLLIIPKILILTEGFSEVIYFTALKNKFSLSTLSVKKSTHTDSVGIIQNAIEIAEESKKTYDKYDYIFCLFDLDTVKNKDFIEKIIKYENQQPKQDKIKILPIYVYPCIEIWFILHFSLCCKPFSPKGKKSTGDMAKAYLKRHAKEYSEKNEECIKSFVHNYEKAWKNSIKLIEIQRRYNSINPICTIHKLVQLLKNISERNNDGYIFEQNHEELFIESHI